MAKVLIQEGVQNYEQREETKNTSVTPLISTEGFRSALEAQQSRRLRGAPKRLRLQRPS